MRPQDNGSAVVHDGGTIGPHRSVGRYKDGKGRLMGRGLLRGHGRYRARVPHTPAGVRGCGHRCDSEIRRRVGKGGVKTFERLLRKMRDGVYRD